MNTFLNGLVWGTQVHSVDVFLSNVRPQRSSIQESIDHPTVDNTKMMLQGKISIGVKVRSGKVVIGVIKFQKFLMSQVWNADWISSAVEAIGTVRIQGRHRAPIEQRSGITHCALHLIEDYPFEAKR